ncbi:MAG: tetratricopeptide repeat protein, partial [Opitutaceae bacterium]
YPPALMIVALDQERKGDDAGAGQTYETILAKDPPFASAARRLALLDGETLGNDARAEELANQALTSFPGDPELEYVLGTINYRQADYTDAVKFLQESEHAGADRAETHFYLGVSYFQIKDTADAKNELRRALAMNLPVREAGQAKQLLNQLGQDMGGP